ncbi:hypothetical protein [Labrys monachus]|uniref:Uncharacterized protein n=1 Tax=Labrys monachus TaxID=217067 RepID=A0ABU0F7X5_9HYPH|nr:hypothetical protein [Labrys monachus]MDQ0390680.1 hypothetical protein [Labrys monachus]
MLKLLATTALCLGMMAAAPAFAQTTTDPAPAAPKAEAAKPVAKKVLPLCTAKRTHHCRHAVHHTHKKMK